MTKYSVEVRDPRLYWHDSGDWYTAKVFAKKKDALQWANTFVKNGSVFQILKTTTRIANGEVEEDYTYSDFTIVG